MQDYQIEVFLVDYVSGKKTSCGKYKTPVENSVLSVDLPKDLPELARIEIEFFSKVQK